MMVWLFHRPVRTFRIAGAVGVVGALLTAFWSVPLLATFAYTANMRYEKLTWYLDYLFPPELWWVFALAAIGSRRRAGPPGPRASSPLITLTGVFALVFRVWPELHAWNLRFLPFWYLGLFLLAGVGAAEIVRGDRPVGRRRLARCAAGAGRGLGARPGGGRSPLPAGEERDLDRAGRLLVATGGLVYAHHERGFLDFWAEWNYSGYQDSSPTATKPKPWAEYHDLMEQMGRLPAGRAMWEGGQAIDAYGTSLALMLLPYWTHGRIASMEGLYYESSATTPFHFMAVAPLSGPGNASNPVRGLDYRTIDDFNLGVRYMQLLGRPVLHGLLRRGEGPREREPGPRADRAGGGPGQGTAARLEHLRGEGRRRRSRRSRTSRWSRPRTPAPSRSASTGAPVAGQEDPELGALGVPRGRAGGTIRAPSTGPSPRVARPAGPGSRRPRPRPHPGAGCRR